MLQTPVVLMIFHRPDTTAQVFARIREAQPHTLFVVADGPRPDKSGEAEAVAAARYIIDNGVDWECDIRKNYAATNLGLKERVLSGLNWVFAQVDQAIILEDDTVPHPSFFTFSAKLLDYYAHDSHVMMISGYNPLGEWKAKQQSYHFSHLPNIWGWATWSRAWRHNTSDTSSWFDGTGKAAVRRYYSSRVIYREMAARYDMTFSGRLTTWDYYWVYAMALQNGLSIVPAVNMIENIGFGAGATNTLAVSRASQVRSRPMIFPLRHPTRQIVDTAYDRERHVVLRNMGRRRALLFRIRHLLNV